MSILRRARSRLPQEYLAGGGIVRRPQYRQDGGDISPEHGRYTITSQTSPGGVEHGRYQYNYHPFDISNFAGTSVGAGTTTPVAEDPVVETPVVEEPVVDTSVVGGDTGGGSGGGSGGGTGIVTNPLLQQLTPVLTMRLGMKRLTSVSMIMTKRAMTTSSLKKRLLRGSRSLLIQ